MKKVILIGALTIAVLIICFGLFHYYDNQSFYFKEHIDVKTKLLPTLGNISLYDYYSNLNRPYTNDYSLYVLNPHDDKYLNDYFKNMTFDEILFFCQNIPYKSEGIDIEYPKYPIETIVDNCGDCEDKSILCANIFNLFGYNISLVRFDSHMMILVNDILIETTGTNNRYLLNDAVDIYPLVSHPIFVLDWNGTIYSYKNSYFASLNVTICNYGDIGGNTILCIYDNADCYEFPLSIDSFSVSLIELNIKVLSGDIDCKLQRHGLRE